jgi:Asp-tRNA(Asn)/Glu-tRNA(Gln) amidotransferase C subunit
MLPRVSTFLSLSRIQSSKTICIRNVVSSVASTQFHTISTRKLAPPVPPGISKSPGVDLNEFLGSPGWKIDDLLPASRGKSPDVIDDISITPETLRHLLRLSGLPPPKSCEEESNLLSALHDQLHFVRHVQSVPTEGVKPLIRVGNEPQPRDEIGVLRYEECVEESKSENIPGLEWTSWDVCGLKGGSHEGREEGWFIVREEQTSSEEADE